MDYKAIARKFRPQTFAEVTGQEAIVTTLKQAVIQKRAGHAYLFSGIRGTGKTSLARIFAKALNCESHKQGEPCNVCPSCTEIMSGKSLDFIEIDGASHRGIDDIRNLNETLGYKALRGAYKIYLIDEVHMLTKEAFNALLKSLEEPPVGVKFFFATTEPHKVLPTIVSRCQRFTLGRIPNHQIIKKLRSISKQIGLPIEDDALACLARMGEGSLRDAETLFDQVSALEGTITEKRVIETLGWVGKEALFALDQAFLKGDLAFSYAFSEMLFVSGKDITYAIEMILEHYRNHMMIQLGYMRIDDAFVTEEERAGYALGGTIYTKEQLMHILDYLSELLHQTTRPIYKRVHLEMIVLHVLQVKKRLSLEVILQKVLGAEPMAKEASQEQREEKEIRGEEKKGDPAVTKPVSTARHDTIVRFAQVELGATKR